MAINFRIKSLQKSTTPTNRPSFTYMNKWLSEQEIQKINYRINNSNQGLIWVLQNGGAGGGAFKASLNDPFYFKSLHDRAEINLANSKHVVTFESYLVRLRKDESFHFPLISKKDGREFHTLLAAISSNNRDTLLYVNESSPLSLADGSAIKFRSDENKVRLTKNTGSTKYFYMITISVKENSFSRAGW